MNGWQKLQKEFMELTKQKLDDDLYIELISEEICEWAEEAYLAPTKYYNEEAELKEFTDLLYVMMGYANCMGWDLDEAFKRVDANNKGRCVQPDGSIEFNEQGKVLKNKAYPKVDLSDLVGDK